MSDLLFLVSVLTVAGIVNSTFGFSFSIISMSLLTLVLDLQLVATLIPIVYMVANVTILSRAWKDIQFKVIIRILIGSILAIPVGIYASVYVPEWIIRLLVGSMLISFGVYGTFQPNVPTLKSQRFDGLIGVFSGFFGGAYNISGPPLVLYGVMKKWDPPSFRATLQGYFGFVTITIIAVRWYGGFFSQENLWFYFLCGAPIAVITAPIGKFFNAKFTNLRTFHRYVYMLIILLGLVMIIKAISLL